MIQTEDRGKRKAMGDQQIHGFFLGEEGVRLKTRKNREEIKRQIGSDENGGRKPSTNEQTPMLIVQDADLVSAITDPNKRVVDMSSRTGGHGKDGVL